MVKHLESINETEELLKKSWLQLEYLQHRLNIGNGMGLHLNLLTELRKHFSDVVGNSTDGDEIFDKAKAWVG